MSSSRLQESRDSAPNGDIERDSHSYFIPLSDRELEVARLCAEGFTSVEISKKLHLAAETVKDHRKKIILKTASRNITHAVVTCIRRGLI